MDSFVTSIVSKATGEMEDLVGYVVDGYWGTIFSILFVGFVIGLAWWAARKVFGHKQF